MKAFIKKYTDDFSRKIKELNQKKIHDLINLLLRAKKEGKTIYILGNGGSASISTHFAADLSKNSIRCHNDNKELRLKVISLTDNIASISAYANDLGYENVFSEPLKNLLCEGDIVIAISGSGNSINVLNAIKLAKKKKAVTYALLGFNGGKAKKIVDNYIIFYDNDYGRIESAHSFIAHLVTLAIKNNGGKDNLK